MSITPCNRYLLVEPVESVEEETGILLPDDYTKKSIYGKARVVAMSKDCTVDVETGQYVVYQNSMLENVQIGVGLYNMILQNHIICKTDQ